MTISDNLPQHNIGVLSIEKEIILFEQTWRAPRWLRPEHKEALKDYISKKEGRDGTRALCCFCNKEFGVGQLQIHHPDHDRRNNRLSNIRLACEPCNNDENRTWYSQQRAARRIGVVLKKESDSMETEKNLQEQLLKQAPTTFQKSVAYKKQVQAYLIEYVKDTKSFDTAVADIEALTGCSHNKAIEYLNAFSLSVFAGWRQWFTQEGQWIAPRRESEAYKKALEQTGQ